MANVDAVSCVCVLVIWWVLYRRLGVSYWRAWAVTAVLLLGVGAFAQFVVWPNRW